MAKDETGDSKPDANTIKAEAGNGGKGKAETGKDAASARIGFPASSADPGAAASAVEQLKADHREVEKLFAEYETADDGRKDQLIEQICSALVIHTLLEEQIFYPACRQAADDDEPLNEAQVEHDAAKILINDLERSDRQDRYRDAKVKVLSEEIRHHVAEEEKPGDGIFAQAEAKGIDTPNIARQLQRLKGELQQRADRLPAARPVALGANSNQTKENAMPNQYSNDRDRDDRGRFTNDDDDRNGGRSYGANRGRDDEGRFTSGRGRNDDGGGYRGSGGQGDRGRGQGGWFGDSQGHSEAARRGAESRSYGGNGGRNDDDYYGRQDNRGRDDQGRFTSGGGGGGRGRDDDRNYGSNNRNRDEEGRFTSGRGGGNDDDRGYRGRDDQGQGEGRGWYGDPQGHSEASRRGWEERNGGGRGYASRDRDDDDRSGRSRGDHGGWFGDSRGHSEAARKGWDDRR